MGRFPAEQESRDAPAAESGERQDLDRQHADGHGQDQGVRLQSEGGQREQGRRDRARREGEDEGQGRPDLCSRHERFHQQTADLQLPRTALRRQRCDGDRARRLRRNRGLALVTGGEIVSTFGKPELVKIGKCDLIEQVSIGDETLLEFSGVPLGEACSVVLRGATEQIIGEAERSLHDALCVLTSTVKEPRTLYGGGCSELLMARAVDELSSVTPGKEARSITSFANALRQLPSIIAENGGYDSAHLVSELKAKHILGESTMGLNMTEGKVGCMKELGITESFSVKRQVLVQASEAAEMILRVDDILKAAPRQREQDRSHC